MKILGEYEVTRTLTPTWALILGAIAFFGFALATGLTIKFAEEDKKKLATICTIITVLCIVIVFGVVLHAGTHLHDFTVYNVELDGTLTAEEISTRYRIVKQEENRLLVETKLGYYAIEKWGHLYVE